MASMLVLTNHAISLAADGAGFSRIAQGQYAIFIALRGYDESQGKSQVVSDDQKMSKSCLKSSKRRKKKPKIRKRV